MFDLTDKPLTPKYNEVLFNFNVGKHLHQRQEGMLKDNVDLLAKGDTEQYQDNCKRISAIVEMQNILDKFLVKSRTSGDKAQYVYQSQVVDKMNQHMDRQEDKTKKAEYSLLWEKMHDAVHDKKVMQVATVRTE